MNYNCVGPGVDTGTFALAMVRQYLPKVAAKQSILVLASVLYQDPAQTTEDIYLRCRQGRVATALLVMAGSPDAMVTWFGRTR